MRRVLVLGASGMTGRHLVREWAAAHPEDVILPLGRRLLPEWSSLSGVRPMVMPHLDRLSDFESELDVDVVLSCWGTTRAKAGSASEFTRWEKDVLLAILAAARAKGAAELFLQSSVGADAASSNLYLRVKGEIEEAAQAMGWEKCAVARPSLLLGERAEPRLGEGLARATAWAYNWALPWKYKAVPALSVARTCVRAWASLPAGTTVWQGRDLFEA